jgi:hypothetical protein
MRRALADGDDSNSILSGSEPPALQVPTGRTEMRNPFVTAAAPNRLDSLDDATA